MRPYQTVYRFRFLPDTGAWQKSILYPALVSGTAEKYIMSDALTRDAKTVIRIVSEEKQDVSSGDVITFSDCTAPPGDGSVTVLSVTDNRRGTKCISHTKLVCA